MLPQRRLLHARGYIGLGLLGDAENELVLAERSGAETGAVAAVRMLLLHEREDWPAVRTLARTLIARILFLGGKPNVAKRVPIVIGDDVPSMLKSDLDVEYRVAAALKDVIAVCEQERDYITREQLMVLLEETENDHAHWLEQQPEIGRVLVLLGGGDRNWRAIYTDGRPAAQADEVVPTYYGTSVGKWDGNTLVVDATGFNESFWFANGGLPHTEALHLTEKFTRTDRNTLRYEVTVDDPRAYTRPWTGGWTLRWVANEDIEEFFCEENAESTFTR